MAKRIDWYYHRSGWTSCKRADAHLEAEGATVRETVKASKEKLQGDDVSRPAQGT
jgi:hypothetical protein